MGAGCGKLEGHWKKNICHRNSALESAGKNWGMQATSMNATPSRELLLLQNCCLSPSTVRILGVPQNGHPTPLHKTHVPGHCTDTENRTSVNLSCAVSLEGIAEILKSLKGKSASLALSRLWEDGFCPALPGLEGMWSAGTSGHVCGWNALNWDRFAEPVFAENITLTLAGQTTSSCQIQKMRFC